MFTVLGGKVCCLIVVSTLPTHRDSRVQIKFEIARRLDEFLKLSNVLELGITVEEQCRMICSGLMMFVQFFKIFDEVVNSLRIQKLYYSALIKRSIGDSYLSNDLRWFSIVDCLQILLHSTIVIRFLVQKVAILAVYHVLLLGIHPRLLSQRDGIFEKVPLIQDFQSLLQRLLVVSPYLCMLAGNSILN